MYIQGDYHLPPSGKSLVLWKAFLGGLCFCFAAGTQARAVPTHWPKLDAPASPQCDEALQIAKAVFDSDAFYLYAPPAIPVGLASTLALAPMAVDISGGDALVADATVFDRISTDAGAVYWEKAPGSARRLVVRDALFNWQGDIYSLYAVGKAILPDQFLAEIAEGGATPTLSPVLESWRPPLVLHDGQSDSTWFIDVGQPYQIMADWQVYVADPSGANRRCTIQFHPHVQSAIDMLPGPVRQYEKLLDRTMGSGADEGTLHPTARLRLDVAYAWANAAQRPWVSSSPYNSKEEIEAALQTWSQQSALNGKLYRQIRRQYPLAEQALGAYYQRQFGRTAPQAKALSAHMLDMALRSHYVFHRETGIRSADD